MPDLPKIYCFTVTKYDFTEDGIKSHDDIRIEKLNIVEAINELASYVRVFPDCYASNDGFAPECEDEVLFGVTSTDETWSAQISVDLDE